MSALPGSLGRDDRDLRGGRFAPGDVRRIEGVEFQSGQAARGITHRRVGKLRAQRRQRRHQTGGVHAGTPAAASYHRVARTHADDRE